MILSDLHVHSTFCDGKSTVEETVKAAIAKRMVSVGFSAHGYTFFDTSYCMKKEVCKDYAEAVRAAAEKYAASIRVFLGMEKDMQAGDWMPDVDFDYIIGSAHYIKKDGVYIPVDESAEITENAINEHFGGDCMAYVKSYYETAAEIPQRTKTDIIGHFDLVTKYNYPNKYFDENSTVYRNAALEALDAVSEKCNVLELNTGAISRGYRPEAYPSDFILRRAKELGMKIILSSDSHNCKNLCFGFSEAAERLKNIGFKSRAILGKNGFEEVDIMQ